MVNIVIAVILVGDAGSTRIGSGRREGQARVGGLRRDGGVFEGGMARV